MPAPPPRSTLFPYTTLFRSERAREHVLERQHAIDGLCRVDARQRLPDRRRGDPAAHHQRHLIGRFLQALDRKSTRLNSSHSSISYAVFCLKQKTTTTLTSDT